MDLELAIEALRRHYERQLFALRWHCHVRRLHRV